MSLGPAYGDGFAGKSNPADELYVRGNENTNLSIRFVPESDTSLAAELQAREDGVWNRSDLILGAATMKLGEASVSSAFAYLEVEAPGELFALTPHIEFDTDGTTLVHTPVLGALADFDIATGATSELVGTTITQIVTPNFANLVDKITHETGSVGATEEITYTIYSGTDNTGPVKNRINLPASDFPASSSVDIVFKRAFGVEAGESIFLELVSTATFSMATNASGNLITVFEAYPLAELGIVTENLILDGDLNMVFDGDLNPVYGSQF